MYLEGRVTSELIIHVIFLVNLTESGQESGICSQVRLRKMKCIAGSAFMFPFVYLGHGITLTSDPWTQLEGLHCHILCDLKF